jgi:hypothetical protein
LSIHCIYYKYVLTKQNPQPCKNSCGAKIYLSDKKQKGRYLPYELDDNVHDCPKKPVQTTIATIGQDNSNSNTKTRSEQQLKSTTKVELTESDISELADIISKSESLLMKLKSIVRSAREE